jgi:hypothetical protein
MGSQNAVAIGEDGVSFIHSGNPPPSSQARVTVGAVAAGEAVLRQ